MAPASTVSRMARRVEDVNDGGLNHLLDLLTALRALLRAFLTNAVKHLELVPARFTFVFVIGHYALLAMAL
jgi:hypothetical protein